jgi:hypothetical protein
VRKRIAICLFISVTSIAFLAVDHYFRNAKDRNPLYAPITLSEPASDKAKADFKAAQISASNIQCNLEGVSFVAIPNTSDIQVLGLKNGNLYLIAGQLVTYKRDVIESKIPNFDLTKPCSKFTLGGKALVSTGKWTNEATMSVVVFDQYGVPKKLVSSGASVEISTGETGSFAY